MLRDPEISCGFDDAFSESPEKTERFSGLSLEERTDKAFAKIIRCAQAKERSTEQMRKKLSDSGFDAACIDMALERAIEASIIDDRRYCDALIRATLAQGKGLHFAMKEAEELGIDATSLDAYQECFEDGSEDMVERAVACLERHHTSSKNKHAACYRKLMSKGYDAQVASEAARIWCERHGFQTHRC